MTFYLWLLSLCHNDSYRSVHDYFRVMERRFTPANFAWLGSILGLIIENKNN